MSFDDVAIAARVVVALVLVASGVGKLWSIWQRKGQFAEFGGYAFIALGTALALPLAEVGIAAIVLFVDAVWPVLIALAAFATFTVVLARRYVKGDLRPCNCFGQVSTAKALSNLSMARNVWFLALAAIAVAAEQVADPGHPATTLTVGAIFAGVSGMLIARA